jgi:chromosome segregation ATPase
VIPEEHEAPRKRPPPEGERDTLAERRARRAWLGDAALLRRAEAAETTVRTLEAHLADLRRRQVEAEHEREDAAAQLAERELELRRVKQREYAEQQLRVAAEETAVRARRGHRAELDRWQRRAEEARAAAQHAEEQRDALAARLTGVNQSCARLQRGVAALQVLATDLRVTFERDHHAAQARIRELEGELERALARAPGVEGAEAEDAVRREEMAGALAAAVARLRARVDVAGEEPEPEPEEPRVAETPIEQAPPRAPQAGAPPPEVPTVIVVPRLFASRGRYALRFAPAVRRVAVRLAEWADRAQGRAR